MKIFACFPSKYLKAADLYDKHIRVVISHVAMEEVTNKDGAELLPILYFNGVAKGMVLNITNSKTISAIYGEETEAWAGMPIILFPAMVSYGADTVPAIRMKAPSAAERIRAINESQHKDALSEHMVDQVHERQMTASAIPHAPTEAELEYARQVFVTSKTKNAIKKPTPRPKVFAAQDVIHDADGVVWEETGERPLTPAERTEQLTAQLKESLARANAALEERKEARGATKPDEDGLGIPTFLQRPKPSPGGQAAEPDYGPNSWIELMQAAE